MLIVLFIILLYNVIVTLLGKADRSRAFCGLVGYCGSTPGDAMLLRILLMYNNSRGGDSTGWAINNKITKDLGKVEDFLTKNKLVLSESDQTYTFIAHARKSSSGLRGSKDHAHPFGIYKDGVESDRFDLILAMNGTLNNETAFGDHFEFPWDRLKHSDTEMLSKVMAKLGPKDFVKALEGYGGCATLLFYTPKWKNVLMVYRDPIRELYYWQKGPNQIYISSLKSSFISVGAPEEEIFEFEGDHLYKIVKGEIKSKTKIERVPLFKAVVSKFNNSRQGSAAYNQSQFNRNNVNNHASYYNMDINKLNTGGDKLVLLYDKYFRNHHGATGEFWVNDKGELLTLKAGETYEQFPTYKKRWFMAGYMIKSEEAFNKFKEKVYIGNAISWPKMQETKTSELLEYVDYPLIGIGITGEKEKYWMVPADMQDSLEHQETEEFSFTHFLSEYRVVFKSAKRKIKGTNILCFDLKSFHPITKDPLFAKDLSRGEIIRNSFKKTDVEKFIIAAIKEDPNILAADLFSQTRIYFFNMNGDKELMEFFYNEVLLDMMYKRGIVDTHDHNNIQIVAENNEWDAKFPQAELNKLVKLFSRHLEEEVDKEPNKIPVGDFKSVVTDINDLPARQRLQVDQFNPAHALSGLSAKAAVEEIALSNPYLSMGLFNNEMVSPNKDKYDDFANQYVDNNTDVNKETVEFAIAVLIKLKEMEDINTKKLVEVFAYSNDDLIKEVKYLYEQRYTKILNDISDDPLNPEERRSFHDTLGDERKEDDDEDTVDEQSTIDATFTADDSEKEIEDMFANLMEQIALFRKDCELIQVPYRTARIDLIQKEVGEGYNYMKRYIKEISYMNEDD